MKGILLIAHGSRHPALIDEMRACAETISAKTGLLAEAGFLEIAVPTIEEAVDLLSQKGVTHFWVLQHFLNSGRHTTEDIPRILQGLEGKYPEHLWTLAPPVGLMPDFVQLYQNWIDNAK